VTVTLVWRATAVTQPDFTRFVHLIAPDAPGPPVAQVDSLPRQNSYPTSQWVQDEVVVDTVILPLTAVPPGRYQLTVGFYTLNGAQAVRATAVAADGSSLPNDSFLVATPVEIDP
jgi:hypothetical protein